MSEPRFPRGILASCVVPWDDEYRFMEDLFRAEVANVVAGADMAYIFGTAGEGYAVSESQFDAITRSFAEEMRRHGAEPMVGVISPSVPTVMDRIDRAKSVGVRQFQISLPSWGTCSVAEAADFFGLVCGAHPDCQFLHYNLMRVGRLIEPTEYAAIAKENPNLVATKNSSQSVVFLTRLQEYATELRHFVTDMGFATGAFVGECGFLIATASCNWEAARLYYDACVNRDSATAVKFQRELIDLNEALHRATGPEPKIDGAYDKLYARMHHPSFPLRLLPPYHGCSDEVFNRFVTILQDDFPRWYPGGRNDDPHADVHER